MRIARVLAAFLFASTFLPACTKIASTSLNATDGLFSFGTGTQPAAPMDLEIPGVRPFVFTEALPLNARPLRGSFALPTVASKLPSGGSPSSQNQNMYNAGIAVEIPNAKMKGKSQVGVAAALTVHRHLQLQYGESIFGPSLSSFGHYFEPYNFNGCPYIVEFRYSRTQENQPTDRQFIIRSTYGIEPEFEYSEPIDDAFVNMWTAPFQNDVVCPILIARETDTWSVYLYDRLYQRWITRHTQRANTGATDGYCAMNANLFDNSTLPVFKATRFSYMLGAARPLVSPDISFTRQHGAPPPGFTQRIIQPNSAWEFGNAIRQR